MALVFADFVKDTTTTTGTGTYTLANSAPSGFQTFGAGIGNANQTCYAITDGAGNWESGVGTYTSSGTTLSRDTITGSSNSGAAVSWSAGTKTIYCDMPANRGQGAVVSLNNQSAGYTLLLADFGRLVEFTGSSDATFAFTAAASLGNSWWCYLKNAGTSNARVLLDPNGAETIDGLTSYRMLPGEVRLVQCTGTAFNTIILHGFAMAYTATVTGETVPPGYGLFQVEMWGGGASGGSRTSAGSSQSAGPGTGGGHVLFQLPVGSLGSTWDANVGAAVAGVSGNSNGTAGNNSTFVSNSVTYTANGGTAGSNAAGSNGGTAGVVGGIGAIYQSTLGAAGAAGTSGVTAGGNAYDGSAGSGGFSNTAVGSQGSTVYGGGTGGQANNNTTSAPGTTIFGGAGGAANSNGNATAGSAPGGGGGGSDAGTSGGGARGEIRVRGLI